MFILVGVQSPENQENCCSYISNPKDYRFKTQEKPRIQMESEGRTKDQSTSLKAARKEEFSLFEERSIFLLYADL